MSGMKRLAALLVTAVAMITISGCKTTTVVTKDVPVPEHHDAPPPDHHDDHRPPPPPDHR